MSTINEIFTTLAADKTEELDFSFETEFDLNNSEAMSHFLADYDLEQHVHDDEGTTVILQHEEYDFPVVVVSEGLGDFFSHGIFVFFDPEAEFNEQLGE